MTEITIQERLWAIQSALKAPKGQINKFGNYNYRSCEDIFEAVKPLLKENNLVLVISDEIVEIAGRFYVKAMAQIADKNEKRIQTHAYAREAESKKGMDEAQITGACSSYARKYALNGLFAIDDTKDADHDNDHGKRDSAKPKTQTNPEPDTKKPMSEAQGKLLDKLVEWVGSKDKGMLQAELLKRSTFTPTKGPNKGKEVKGKTSILALTDKHADVIRHGIEKDLESRVPDQSPDKCMTCAEMTDCERDPAPDCGFYSPLADEVQEELI